MVAYTVRFLALAILATALGLATGSLAFSGTDRQEKGWTETIPDILKY